MSIQELEEEFQAIERIRQASERKIKGLPEPDTTKNKAVLEQKITRLITDKALKDVQEVAKLFSEVLQSYDVQTQNTVDRVTVLSHDITKITEQVNEQAYALENAFGSLASLTRDLQDLKAKLDVEFDKRDRQRSRESEVLVKLRDYLDKWR